MIVVADYTHVLIPQTVADELKKEKAPAAVQTNS